MLFHEGKGYLVNENKCTEILTEIEELRKSGAVILYYRELYEKNEEWFYNLGIFSDEMLKKLLQKYAEDIICRKSYFSWSQGTENELLKEYIRNVWGESVLHDYSDLNECMEYVPIEKSNMHWQIIIVLYGILLRHIHVKISSLLTKTKK